MTKYNPEKSDRDARVIVASLIGIGVSLYVLRVWWPLIELVTR